MTDKHDPLHKQQKHTQHSDNDIEVGDELRPRERVGDGAVVGVGIDDFVGIAVPAVVGAFLPEFGAV